MPEATGERLLPDQQRGELVHAEHLARYRFASQLARGRRVLDAASGEGYGTAMLARAGAASVTGVEIDAAAVDLARGKYGLEFVEGNVCALPFDNGSFDLVVSFETVEHVEDPAAAIAEFKRVLATDGILVVSTPNASESLVENPFHTREFTPDEFSALLAGHFEPVRLLFQQNWLLSAVLGEEQFRRDDGDSALDLELVKVAGCDPGRELYSVAVCGPADDRLAENGVMTAVYEAHKLADGLIEAEKHVRAWVERAGEAERLVEAWVERASEAERQLTEAREKIAGMESSVSWRVTRPLRWGKAAARRR